MPVRLRLTLTTTVVVAFAVATLRALQAAPAQAPTSAVPAPTAPAAVFSQYCVTCHNARLKTAGLIIEPGDLTKGAGNQELLGKWETWEKVVRKLRSSTMPPAGAPRPDQATYDAVAAYVEGELDRAASTKPNPGSLPLLHRLSRTEYQNAIRDLLAIDALPKEMDYSLLLPSDNVSSGFDNIADLLFVSPTTMERYLEAARKISRLAVGDPSMPAMVNIHRLHPEHWQDARVEELSIGTRGGLAVRSYFRSTPNTSSRSTSPAPPATPTRSRSPLDNERVQLTTVGENGRGGRAGGRGAPAQRAAGIPDPGEGRSAAGRRDLCRAHAGAR